MEQSRIEAATQGLLRYQGRPCRSCGSTERFVSNGNCVACSQEHVKKYREKIRERLNQARAEA